MSSSPSLPEPSLIVKNVSHRYQSLVALDNLSLQVDRKQIFGILGPNGSGKSTLFRLMATLTTLQTGTINVAGYSVSEQTLQARQNIGVVFQSPSLDRKLTVVENIRCQAALYGLYGNARDKRIAECVELFGLSDKMNVRCEKLSGGQKRRVELAKGLLHRPSLLLLDEPSTGLDPSARLDLWQALVQLRDIYGTSVILTTHLLDEADKCDRIAILNQGTLVACDSPEHLRSETSQSVMMISVNQPEDFVLSTQQRFRVEAKVFDQQVRISMTHSPELVSEILQWAQPLANSITIGRPSLEDVFIQKTGHKFHSS